MIAPAASTEEAVVDAENIVSLWGLPERKFVTIKSGDADNGNRERDQRWRNAVTFHRPHGNTNVSIAEILFNKILSQICEARARPS